VGALRTNEAQDLAKDAQAVGCKGLLLAPVSYTPLTDEEVYQHFLAVSSSTTLPLCIYNNPGTTHFNFSPDLLKRLSLVDNICAVKMPLPASGATFQEEMKQLRTPVLDEFAIGYSGDWGCAEALLAGADTWYSVVAGLFPVPAKLLTEASQRGDGKAVQEIDQAFAPMWELFQEFGSIRVTYAAANILARTDALPPRPVLPLTNSRDLERISVAIEKLEQCA
jgi:4-hydroxy-tetrahydrodipicolinate synthase